MTTWENKLKAGLDFFVAARREVYEAFDLIEMAHNSQNTDAMKLAKETFADASRTMRITMLQLEKEFGIGGAENAE